MARKFQSFGDFSPGSTATLADETWQRQELARIGLRLGCTDRTARFGADRDEIVVSAADGAAVEVEPEPELGEQQQLIANEGRAPAACRWSSLNRIQEAFERLVERRIGLTFRQCGRGQHRRPFDRCCR